MTRLCPGLIVNVRLTSVGGGEGKPTTSYQKSPWLGSAPRSNACVVAFAAKVAEPLVGSGRVNPFVAGGAGAPAQSPGDRDPADAATVSDGVVDPPVLPG